jgi:hypothetical protein
MGNSCSQDIFKEKTLQISNKNISGLNSTELIKPEIFSNILESSSNLEETNTKNYSENNSDNIVTDTKDEIIDDYMNDYDDMTSSTENYENASLDENYTDLPNEIIPVNNPIKFEKMKFIYEYKEYPEESNDLHGSYSKCELITHDAKITIPILSCIHYENKLFTFESLENDENGVYVPRKFLEKATYFDNRVNNVSIETSILDAEKALIDFRFKNNFSVIFGTSGCCSGYAITKFGFDFSNNNISIEQDSCWGCDNRNDISTIHNYVIDDNNDVLFLMLNTLLEYIKNKRKNSCTRAASHGNIEWLKYAQEKGYHWDKWTCSSAAAGGYIECLKYLHENGCPWGEKTIEFAVHGEHFECLKYAIENGCPYGDEITRWAAEGGSLECLKYLHEQGCPFHEMTTFAAAQHGNLNCLMYAVENGAPKHPETCRMALGNLRGDACYNYAITNGFPDSIVITF